MVFEKIKNVLNSNDEKYEILYYKYSKIKLENKRLQEEHKKELTKTKNDVHEKMAKHLIELFKYIEIAKEDSFKVKASDKDLQRLLIDLNTIEKNMRKVMKDFLIEEIIPNERMFDPELHDVSTYQDAKGMTKGLLLKTTKKGFKYKNKTIIKPKVVVTK